MWRHDGSTWASDSNLYFRKYCHLLCLNSFCGLFVLLSCMFSVLLQWSNKFNISLSPGSVTGTWFKEKWYQEKVEKEKDGSPFSEMWIFCLLCLFSVPPHFHIFSLLWFPLSGPPGFIALSDAFILIFNF